jgi:C-terminal processing protease CtpA/Prc
MLQAPDKKSEFLNKCALILEVFVFSLRKLLPLLVLVVGAAAQNDQMSPTMRDAAQRMLKDGVDTVKKQYYNPNPSSAFDDRAKQAQQKIASAKTLSESFGIIAWTFDALNDSHTFFQPPRRAFDVENGWRVGFVGDDCFITAVQPGSDAEAKGLKPGDRVLTMEGFRPTRDTMWKLNYAFNTLAPRSAMHFQLVSPGGQPHQVEVNAIVRPLRAKVFDDPNDVWSEVERQQNILHESDPRYAEAGDIFIMKLANFVLPEDKVNTLLGKTKHHENLVIDLRSNPGGYVDALKTLLGGVFDHIEPKALETRGRQAPWQSIHRKGDRAGG